MWSGKTRQGVSKNIREALQMRAKDFGIVMEDTAITHLSFSREYTAAVEAKQVRFFFFFLPIFPFKHISHQPDFSDPQSEFPQVSRKRYRTNTTCHPAHQPMQLQ